MRKILPFLSVRSGVNLPLLCLAILAIGVVMNAGVKAAAADTPPPETVSQVDLSRYAGKWYEIAAIPMFFERKCVGNTTAEYTLQSNGRLSVVNSCEMANGKRQLAIGEGKVVNLTTNAQLKVTFLNLPALGWQYWASGQYWILDLAPDYSTAIVGDATRKYGWILSRTPKLEDSQLAELENTLKTKGYDPCKLILTPQQGGITQKESLCTYLQAHQTTAVQESSPERSPASDSAD